MRATCTPNQELPSIYVQKRQNGGRNSQKALPVPFPFNGPILREADRSFQVVWRTDLEVDLKRTKNYCVVLVAIYLHRMIIYRQYSDKVIGLRRGCRSNALPQSPREKLQLVTIPSSACEKSFL